jgi:hypothetical protein
MFVDLTSLLSQLKMDAMHFVTRLRQVSLFL